MAQKEEKNEEGTTEETNEKPILKYQKICELKRHSGKINCMCELKNGYLITSFSRVAFHIIRVLSLEELIILPSFNWIISLISVLWPLKVCKWVYPHGMYGLLQLRDSRICTITSNNSLIFWRKWGSFPYC